MPEYSVRVELRDREDKPVSSNTVYRGEQKTAWDFFNSLSRAGHAFAPREKA